MDERLRVTIVLGDRGRGSPGNRAQSFQESAHVFQVFVDPTNACQAQPVPNCPVVPVVAGEPVKLVLTLPGQATVGEGIPVHLRGEDRWGNPTPGPNDIALRWDGTAEGAIRAGSLRVKAPGRGRVIATWNGADHSCRTA